MMIGICGKSGSGKSTLANKIIELSSRRAIHLDIDKIGHSVLLFAEVKKELIKSFGTSIVSENEIDRKKLGEVVFASRHEMKRLSDITWEYMQKEIDQFLSEKKDEVIVLDWILLSHTKYFEMCDLKILLDIPYELRKQRVMKRDDISSAEFDKREKASINFNPEDFDYVFDTNEEELTKKVVNLL